MAMDLISRVELTDGAAASVLFNNIPQIGKDIVVKFSGRATETTLNTSVDVNGLGPTSFSKIKTVDYDWIQDLRYQTLNYAYVPGSISHNSSTASSFSSTEYTFYNYAASLPTMIRIDGVVPDLLPSSSEREGLVLGAFKHEQSAPITSLGFAIGYGNLAQYTSISLYLVY